MDRKEYYQKWAEANRDKVREKQRRWYQKHREKILVKRKADWINKPEEMRLREAGYYNKHLDATRARARRYYANHSERVKIRMKVYNQTHREQALKSKTQHNLLQKILAIQWLGGACACCGEDRPEFLEASHPNGDGAKHRRETGYRNVWFWVSKNPEEARKKLIIECANCNRARETSANGICPHKNAQNILL